MALPVSRRGRLVSRLAAGATRYLRSRGDDNDDQRPHSANATGTPAHPLLGSSLIVPAVKRIEFFSEEVL